MPHTLPLPVFNPPDRVALVLPSPVCPRTTLSFLPPLHAQKPASRPSISSTLARGILLARWTAKTVKEGFRCSRSQFPVGDGIISEENHCGFHNSCGCIDFDDGHRNFINGHGWGGGIADHRQLPSISIH